MSDSLTLSRIDRLYRTYDVTATLPDGEPAVLAGVDFALIPLRTSPTASTTWQPADYVEGEATILLVGPDAAADGGAFVVPADGADLWIRVIDSPEVQAVKAGRIEVR